MEIDLKGAQKIFWVINIFYNLVVVVFGCVYKFVNTHCNLTLNMIAFIDTN